MAKNICFDTDIEWNGTFSFFLLKKIKIQIEKNQNQNVSFFGKKNENLNYEKTRKNDKPLQISIFLLCYEDFHS